MYPIKPMYLTNQAGFSLIELMVGMVIGLLLISGVYFVQIQGHRSYLVSESQTRMLDDGRFAMEMLARDIRMAGSWGDGADVNMVRRQAGQADSLPPLGIDCENNWYNNIRDRVRGGNDTPPFALPGCFTQGNYIPGTDVLTLRYALPDRLADASLSPNTLYMQVGRMTHLDGTKNNTIDGGQFSELFIHGTNPVPTVGSNNNYPVQTITYYVSDYTEAPGDNYPSMHRVSLAPGVLAGGTPVISDEMIAPGVMDLQVQYGLMDDTTNSVTQYVDASDIDWVADRQQVARIAVLRIWVLIRAEEQDLTMDTKTYRLGSKTYVPGNRYRHTLLSGVFKLRNRI